jgi:2'-5' RNA ligase
MYSLWLKPSIESFRRYQSIITDLSDIHQTQSFEPHITLMSGINDISDEAFYKISILAALIKVFDDNSTTLSMHNSYYKSLYATIQSNTTLDNLSAEIQALFPKNNYEFQPHLSLIYSDLTKVEKLKIIEHQKKFHPKLIGLEGIQIMKTIGASTDWETIEHFPFHE